MVVLDSALGDDGRVRRHRAASADTGLFTSEELPRGMSQRPYDFPGDPELAHLIAAKADQHGTWITAIDDDHLPIFYATTNLWSSSARACRTSGGSRSGSARPPTPRTTCDSAGRSATAIAESDRKVVLIASGALSHTFWPLRKLRDHEAAGRRAHLHRRGRARPTSSGSSGSSKGDHARVLDTMTGVLPVQARSPIRPLPDDDRRARRGRLHARPARQYGEYENSIGTGQVHLWFDRPEGGFPRPQDALRGRRLHPPERRTRTHRGRLNCYPPEE